jgi:hypothetical protein
MIESNTNSPTFSLDALDFHWQMTRCEKYAFKSLLEYIKPEVAIEIGTYQGGSLQIISKYSEKVHSIDISDKYKDLLDKNFDNVEFHYGDSKELIPKVLEQISNSNKKIEFVLIDGDHSTLGVKSDIESILKYRPKSDLYIVFHDSFHPASRKGILEANWEASQFVHYVEVDFIPGVFHHKAFDTAKPNTMWGGLCLALLKPEEREGALNITQSQEGLFNCIYKNSAYNEPKKQSLISRIKRKVKALVKKTKKPI